MSVLGSARLYLLVVTFQERFPFFLFFFLLSRNNFKIIIDDRRVSVSFHYCLEFSSSSEKFSENGKLKNVYEHCTARPIAVTAKSCLSPQLKYEL